MWRRLGFDFAEEALFHQQGVRHQGQRLLVLSRYRTSEQDRRAMAQQLREADLEWGRQALAEDDARWDRVVVSLEHLDSTQPCQQDSPCEPSWDENVAPSAIEASYSSYHIILWQPDPIPHQHLFARSHLPISTNLSLAHYWVNKIP